MTDIPAELERLASILDTKSNTAFAKAAEHKSIGEPKQAEVYEKRAYNGVHFAQVCREAAKRLTTKAKRGAFTPPLWKNVLEYLATDLKSWPTKDAQSWFDHFQSVGWKIGNGKPMIDWKSAARNGFRNWKDKNPQANIIANIDPERWIEFLATQPIGFKGTDYKHAPGFMKDEFKQWRKTK